MRVGFQYPIYVASEVDGAVEVCLEIIEDISIYRPFQVRVHSVDGTAIGEAILYCVTVLCEEGPMSKLINILQHKDIIV